MKKLRALAILCFSMVLLLQGCSSNTHGLDPDKPITLTLWHYYSGYQKQSFDKLIEDFNNTTGKKNGIIVDAVAKGSISNISNDLHDSITKKVDAPELPDIFAAYSDTAEEMEKQKKLVNLDDYLSKKEQSEYVQDFLKEGILHDAKHMHLFPIAKATEVLVINKEAWEDFAKHTDAQLSDLKTWEGLVKTSAKYYDYTKGKAFFGRDAVMNYLNVGSEQLGSALFTFDQHDAKFTVSKDVMRKLWDNYYVPYVKGYFVKNGRFASDDMKTLDIIASVSSSASGTFYPNQIVDDEGNSKDVSYIVLQVPNFANCKSYAVTQGAGMAVTKSDEAHEYASVEFLKWFTDAKRNTIFSAESSYLPVKKEANSFTSWQTIIKKEHIKSSPLLQDIVKTSMETVSSSHLVSQKSFTNSYAIRNYLENSLNDKAVKDAAALQKQIQAGTSAKKALSPYVSDAHFEEWFAKVQKDIEGMLQEE